MAAEGQPPEGGCTEGSNRNCGEGSGSPVGTYVHPLARECLELVVHHQSPPTVPEIVQNRDDQGVPSEPNSGVRAYSASESPEDEVPEDDRAAS